MVSFISFFKKSPAFFFAACIIILLELSLYFVPRLEYLETGGSFFTFYKRKISEDSKQSFDILIFGDSRSLSLNGFSQKKKELSIYNFSLPAAGPRYVQFFLKKYIVHHETKPKAVIWAIDMEQYPMAKNKTFDSDKKIWETYKHRLLNLFSFTESLEQYSGSELVFIIKEYLPSIFNLYKYRQGLKDLLSGIKLETFIERETFHTKQNKMIEKIASINLGQINLGDYFIANEEQREMGYEQNYNSLNTKDTLFTFEPLDDFIKYANQNKIKVIILVLPKAKDLYKTKVLSAIHESLKMNYTNKKNIQYLEFPELSYPTELFGEGIHYTTEGASRLNLEYEKILLPKILEFAKSNYEE